MLSGTAWARGKWKIGTFPCKPLTQTTLATLSMSTKTVPKRRQQPPSSAAKTRTKSQITPFSLHSFCNLSHCFNKDSWSGDLTELNILTLHLYQSLTHQVYFPLLSLLVRFLPLSLVSFSSLSPHLTRSLIRKLQGSSSLLPYTFTINRSLHAK